MRADMRWQQAALALSRCPPAAFQPGQLFVLFPCEATAPWIGHFPQQPLWGLAPPLQAADAMVQQHMQATADGAATEVQQALLLDAKRSVAWYLCQVCCVPLTGQCRTSVVSMAGCMWLSSFKCACDKHRATQGSS